MPRCRSRLQVYHMSCSLVQGLDQYLHLSALVRCLLMQHRCSCLAADADKGQVCVTALFLFKQQWEPDKMLPCGW